MYMYVNLTRKLKKMTLGQIDFSLSVINAKGLGARSEGVMFSEWAQCNIIVRRGII